MTVHLTPSKLTIGAEHRQTKKIYRTEIDENVVIDVTHGVCETCEHLFHLLQELIDHDGKCSNKNLDVVDQETKLLLYLTLTVSLGRTSRRFAMEFQLDSVQLDDVTRLENIINEHAQRLEQLEMRTNDCFDHATELRSLHENKLELRNLSPLESVNLTDNDCTIRCPISVQERHKSESVTAEPIPKSSPFGHCASSIALPTPFTFGAAPSGSASMFSLPDNVTTIKQAVVMTNQSFLPSINKRYQLVRFHLHHPGSFCNDDLLFIGVAYRPESKDHSKIISSPDTWLLDVINGTVQHAPFSGRSYTWSLRQMNLQVEKPTNATSHVDLLFDVHLRRVAFRIRDEPEDQWAFHLSKEIKIDQLYPLIILKSATVSVSIHDNQSTFQ